MEVQDDKNADSNCQVSGLPTYYFEETCVYEMFYTSGANLWDFWLSEIKYAKCLEWWKTRIRQKILSNELKKMKHGKRNDLAIVLLPSGLAARVKFLSDTAIDNFGAYNVSLLDVDTGEMMITYIENLYILDEELINKRPLAVNCCLNMDQNTFTKKILDSIRNVPLKVEFKRVTLSNPSKFVVNVFIKIKDRYINLVDILNDDGMAKKKTVAQEAGNNFIYQASKLEKKIGFSKGKEVIDIQVPHIDSLSRFFVWESLDCVKELNSLIHMLNSYYKSTNLMVPDEFLESISCGYACAILDDKELNWYRAEVLNHTKTTDYKGLVQRHYEVLLLDFGSRIEVPISLIKPLDERFFKLPVLAKRCHLFGLQPSPELASPDGSDYSKDVIDIFEIFLDTGKLTLVEAPTSPDDPPNSAPVILERHSKGKDYVINLELLSQKLVTSSVLDLKKCNKIIENAEKGITEPLGTDVGLPNVLDQKPIKGRGHRSENNVFDLNYCANKLCSMILEPSQSKSYVDEEEEFKTWNPMEEDYSNSTYTYENIVNDDASALIGYQAHDEERICKIFARHGHCYKGAGCRKEHKPVRLDGWTTDYQLVHGGTFYHLAFPDPGSVLKLKVMIVTDVCKFYAILENAWRYKECSYEFLPNDRLEDDTLENLVDLINTRENVSKLRALTMPPGVGEIVLCKMQSVNLFYRAKVLDTNLEENNFLVLFVDLGMTDWVNAKRMRQIEMEYLNLPFQAIDCELAYYGVANDTDGLKRMEIMRKLSSMISLKTLKAVVVRNLTALNKMIVQLYDDSGANIGQLLKLGGYLVDVPDIYQEMKVLPG